MNDFILYYEVLQPLVSSVLLKFCEFEIKNDELNPQMEFKAYYHGLKCLFLQHLIPH